MGRMCLDLTLCFVAEGAVSFAERAGPAGLFFFAGGEVLETTGCPPCRAAEPVPRVAASPFSTRVPRSLGEMEERQI